MLKERKKRGGAKTNKFSGIQPVGSMSLGQQGKAVPIPIQQPRKDIDPLVKMEMEKKKKKL